MSADRPTIKLQTYMKICRELATLSHDTKYRVASIAITDDFREICAIGYNGDYVGGPNERTNFEHGQSLFLHSEENLLLHLNKNYELRRNLILMCTHKPCTMCAKRIAGSGINRVIYDTDYHDIHDQTNEIFTNSGVWCVQLEQLVNLGPEYVQTFLNKLKDRKVM